LVDRPDSEALEQYFEIMSERVRSVENLRFYLRYLFEGVDFSGKAVLDVGAGDGKYSLYAACRGATVVGLEPAAAGSRSGSRELFETTVAQRALSNVTLVPQSLQDFDWPDRAFDVILLHASINHLDEDATVRLRNEQGARDVYRELFGKLARLAPPGARIIVVDCSPHNLWARLGRRNPFAPTIEWHKHQPPEAWASLLEDVGFGNRRIRWNSLNTLRRPGQALLGNRFAAYCFASVFCLTMERT
jgi:SAM-dependent methyltransferase